MILFILRKKKVYKILSEKSIYPLSINLRKILEMVIINLILDIFDIQSSATLQKSIHAYSMPKEPRFKARPIA